MAGSRASNKLCHPQQGLTKSLDWFFHLLVDAVYLTAPSFVLLAPNALEELQQFLDILTRRPLTCWTHLHGGRPRSSPGKEKGLSAGPNIQVEPPCFILV